MASSVTKACDELPPAVAENYEPKGKYETFGGLSCYVVGPRDSQKGICFIYDIFGFQPQTIQGADILAAPGYLVVMPDFWQGKPSQLEWYSRDTDEKIQAMATFRERTNQYETHLAKLNEVMDSLKNTFTTVEKWGAIGYCWGGKICSLTSGDNSPWSAVVQSSPSRVDAEDGKKVSVPFASLLSKDESEDDFKAMHEHIQSPRKLEVFRSQIHGWMSARGKLEDEEVRREYDRGYAMAVGWFDQYL